MPSILLIDVTKRFGRIVAIDRVTLEIKDGEYVCVLGPTGSGKTTLLKLIAGLVKPDEGEIRIGGKPVNEVPPQERGTVYVPQDYALFPHMKVIDNVAFGPICRGMEREEAYRIAMKTLKMMRLDWRADSYPHELSGGMQQRVALARGLASGAEILLLDEPLGALDARLRLELRYKLRDLVKDLGLTAIHVTHDQEEAMAISDRIIVMRGGEIVENASPRDLYLKPKRIFTAYFLGETNLLVGEVTEKARGKSIVRIGSNDLRVKGKVNPEAKRVVAAIRPEFISITKKPKRKRDNRWLCKVKSLTFTGNIIRYEVQTVDGIPVLIKMPSTDEEIEAQIGDEVYIEFSSRDVNLYPYPEEGLEKEISLE